MAIDYQVDFGCVPKAELGAWSIVERLKARERAATIVRLFRQNGDQRPPTEMGFEMVRTAPDGSEEVQIVIVQDLINVAAPLDNLAHYCEGCPANALHRPYGCTGFIQYPISSAAERWLLDRLPGADEPLLWLLLRQGVQELHYDGESVKPLRKNGTYFEESRVRGRDMVEFVFSANQGFEMLFLLGDIQPAHAGMLLLFFGAVSRAVEADWIARLMNQSITADEIEARFPFAMTDSEIDDATIAQMKAFFRALYHAWRLNVALRLDV